LPLGRPDLPEVRHVEDVAPGVRYALITRGPSKAAPTHWLITAGIARTTVEAHQAAACLEGLQLAPQPLAFIFPGSNPEPYKEVVAGDFATRSEAANAIRGHHLPKTCRLEVKAWALYPTDDREPWLIHVLTIDPRLFGGKLVSAREGYSVSGRRTVSEISRNRGAVAGVNGGYFVMKASDGVVGDSAGIAAANGVLTSGPTWGRPWVEIDNRGGPHLKFHAGPPDPLPYILWGDGRRTTLDGLNRQPAMLRNCGSLAPGAARQPWHDQTCRVSNQLVAITPQAGFAPSAPTDAAVFKIAQDGAVAPAMLSSTLRPGEALLIATGTRAAELRGDVQRAPHAALSVDLEGGGRGDFAINGGPLLVRHGEPVSLESDEGWPFQLADRKQASAMHVFVDLRNARTAVGETADGKILIVVVDGFRYRNDRPAPLPLNGGATLEELSHIMLGLGAMDAINLDGGGSSVMVVDQKIMTHPSDDAGERAIGDALLVLPDQTK
jgi:hypothetical protein